MHKTTAALIALGSLPVVLSPTVSGATVRAPHTTPTCTFSHLTVTRGMTQGAAGTMFTPIIFTNNGPAACVLSGYPGVQPTSGASHTPVGPPAHHSGSTVKVITLAAHTGKASVAFGATETGNYTPTLCKAHGISGLSISVAGGVGHVALATSVCTKLSSTSVSAIVAGTKGI